MKQDVSFFKEPFKADLRNRINKIFNYPFNVKKGDFVEKANITHVTFLDFMKNKKDTKIKALQNLQKAIESFEEEFKLNN